eukprot:16114434-Heterocapsa_arctica.AAC.1
MLYEWACEGNGRLARWFDQAGYGAVRLHLPEHDLRDRACTTQLVRQIKDVWLRGFQILIWIALPCAAWSKWQVINVTTSPHVARHLDEWRAESIQMVKELVWTIERLQQEGVRPEIAFRVAARGGRLESLRGEEDVSGVRLEGRLQVRRVSVLAAERARTTASEAAA